MSRLRVVFDTNIIIGAHKTRGTCYILLERFKQGHFDLFVNGHLFPEYDKKLNDLYRKGELTDATAISTNLGEVLRRSISVRLPIGIQFPTNDPDDRSLFEIAYTTPIDYIVSTDARDVLRYKGDPTLNGAALVKPEEFLSILSTS